jgi:hypothetical protein
MLPPIIIILPLDTIPRTCGWNNHRGRTFLEYERTVNLPLQYWRLLRISVIPAAKLRNGV